MICDSSSTSRDQHGIPDPMMYYRDQQNDGTTSTSNTTTTNSLWDEQVH